jgi:hypothetical protein
MKGLSRRSGAAQPPAIIAPLDEPGGRELAQAADHRLRGQTRALRHPHRSHAAAAGHRVENPGGLQVQQVARENWRCLAAARQPDHRGGLSAGSALG